MHNISSLITTLKLGLLNDMVIIFYICSVISRDLKWRRWWSVWIIRSSCLWNLIFLCFVFLLFPILASSHQLIKPSDFPQLGLPFFSIPNTVVHYFNFLYHFQSSVPIQFPHSRICLLQFYTQAAKQYWRKITPTSSKNLVSKLSWASSASFMYFLRSFSCFSHFSSYCNTLPLISSSVTWIGSYFIENTKTIFVTKLSPSQFHLQTY